MHSKMITIFKAMLLAIVLIVPSMGWSNTIEEKPSALAMTGDALFVRPVMLVTTVVGGVIFLVSSPFAALGGNIGDSFSQLVGRPFETTFVRCLGCTMNGRKVNTTIKEIDQPKQ